MNNMNNTSAPINGFSELESEVIALFVRMADLWVRFTEFSLFRRIRSVWMIAAFA